MIDFEKILRKVENAPQKEDVYIHNIELLEDIEDLTVPSHFNYKDRLYQKINHNTVVEVKLDGQKSIGQGRAININDLDDLGGDDSSVFA